MAYILRWSVKKEKIGIHMAGNHNEIEKHLWDAADELRANSKLKSSEYSVPVLGMIFLRYADHKFTVAQKELEGKGTGRRAVGKIDYQARGVLYLLKPQDSQNFSTCRKVMISEKPSMRRCEPSSLRTKNSRTYYRKTITISITVPWSSY
jgi:hypothetical protein